MARQRRHSKRLVEVGGSRYHTVVPGQDVEPSKFEVRDLEFISIVRPDERFIDGETMRQRASELHANFGIADGMFILGHQEEMPKDLQDHIVLAGTLLRSPSDGHFVVGILYWDWNEWRPSFLPLAESWTGKFRFPRIKVKR
jgi:hypothetical protein